MAPLSAVRFKTDFPAFTHTAVDFFGPLIIKIGRKTDKRWGALYTCLTSRAVHLDTVEGLFAKNFLMAFRRFIVICGAPKEMVSECGTNFTLASKELRAELKQVDFERVARGLRPLGVDFKWYFNPPASSHQGGVFERMIGLTRSCLRRMMKDLSFRRPNEHCLRTIFADIQGVINSRPLMPCGTDITSYDVITGT